MVEKIEKNVLTAWERVEIARNPKRKTALDYINEIFDEDFKSLDEYKEEKNFKRVVEQITLEDIINAIKRAEKIRDHNKEYNKQIKYGKYIYYKENPDLEINESIEKILNDCEIL